MKQFNLEEYLKNPSRKVITRDGREARIICTDRKDLNYSIVALIDKENRAEQVITFTKDGKFDLTITESSFDLFFAPEKHDLIKKVK